MKSQLLWYTPDRTGLAHTSSGAVAGEVHAASVPLDSRGGWAAVITVKSR